MFVIEYHTVDDAMFVHLASTLEKGVEWVLKHGDNWDDEDYCFFAYETIIDKDEFFDKGTDDAYYINMKGELSKDNPLFKS